MLAILVQTRGRGLVMALISQVEQGLNYGIIEVIPGKHALCLSPAHLPQLRFLAGLTPRLIIIHLRLLSSFLMFPILPRPVSGHWVYPGFTQAVRVRF